MRKYKRNALILLKAIFIAIQENKHKNLTIFILLMVTAVLGYCPFHQEKSFTPYNFVDVITSRQSEITELIEKSKHIESKRDDHPSFQELLKDLPFLQEKYKDIFLAKLFYYALYKEGYRKKYIEEDFVIDCLVSALYQDSLRSIAFSDIFDHVKPSALKRHDKWIIGIWEKMKFEHKLLFLIGSLDTDESRKFIRQLIQKEGYIEIPEDVKARVKDKDILKELRERFRIEIPDEIRAKVGNLEIQKRLIEQFQKESDAKTKGELALKLGYIGTQEAVLALVKEIRTPLIVEDKQKAFVRPKSYSVRYKIIEALGKAFPDEELFNDELQEIIQNTAGVNDDKIYESRGGDYYDRVEKWCQEKFNIQWENPRPPFLLLKGEIRWSPERR